jgi:hypothetical protein
MLRWYRVGGAMRESGGTFQQLGRLARGKSEKLRAIPAAAEVIASVQKLPGKWNIVHTGNDDHALVADQPTQKPLCGSKLRIAQRMATQVQACFMKGLTNNVEALYTVRQQ